MWGPWMLLQKVLLRDRYPICQPSGTRVGCGLIKSEVYLADIGAPCPETHVWHMG